MADKYVRDEEEEYQFPSDEYIGQHEEMIDEKSEVEGEYKPVPPKKEMSDYLTIAREKLIEHKRIVAITGIVIVTLIAFNLLRPHHKTEIISQKTPPSSTAIQTPPVVVQQPLAPPVLQQPAPPAVSVEQYNRLQTANSQSQSQLNQLQDNINNLHQDVQKLQAAQVILNQNLQNLSRQLNSLVLQLNNGERPIKKQKIIFEEPIPVYHLRALIPGRAWLEDDQGQSLSVATGDKLPGYGVVTEINTQQGIIVTSSGRLISYKQ